MNQTERYRLRITFAREETIKYISHLDLARAWERALRRAGVPLAYSQGFNPRPKMAFAAALPVGYTSSAEVVDVFLEKSLSPLDLAHRLASVLPSGLRVISIEEVEPGLPALQSQVRAVEYRVSVMWEGERADLEARVAALLAATTLPRERVHKGRRRAYDLRPLVEALRVEAEGADGYRLWMRLGYGSEGTARPEEVLDALGLADVPFSVERTALRV
ncbi:MAG: TIGR03936 family radical SAM-associated protein [Anaerolineae bacterium]|jgi:radical SAM-linked protein|nr:TIGR03936 family radical SAM-associated protein [Anaerolineae bacterium]MDH7472670.1 TIGR03936 family radical SAM-associated protein [Anaerolineae bacterium]